NECMDANPSNRPSADDIKKKVLRWYKIVRDGIATNKDELVILKAFQSADAVIPKLSTKLLACPQDKLTINHRKVKWKCLRSEMISVY
ncbi:8546_t:CDS:2, partial [Gigaspora margarita]